MRDDAVDVVEVSVAQITGFLAHAPVGRYLLIPGFGGFGVRAIEARLRIVWCPDVEMNAMARGDATVVFPEADRAEEILAEWRDAGIEAELPPATSTALPAFGRLLFESLRAGGSLEIEGLGRFAVVASVRGANVVRFSPGEALLDLLAHRAAGCATFPGAAATSG